MRETLLPRLVRALISTLVLGLGLMPQTASPAQAADAALVFAAYQAIIQNHVDRPDPIKLLTVALTGLRQALAKAGIGERLADLTAADEASARSEFQARFDRAVMLGQGALTVTQLQYAAATAMAGSLSDGWTSFLTPEQWADWNGKGSVVIGKIGILSRYKFGRFVISYVVPYSPAASAGLRPFDRVMAIDGQSVQGMASRGMSGEDIDNRISGPEGTTVKLTILRPGQGAPLIYSLVRQHIIRLTGVVHQKLGRGVGYIWYRSGASNDAAEFRRALVELQREGMRGLLLDLRLKSGGGGYIQGLLIADTLLPAGVPIQTIVSHAKDVVSGVRPEVCPRLIQGHQWYLSDPAPPSLPSPCAMTTEGGTLLDASTPLVVLIDETSHHISETLSAAIREARRGKLLGVRTAGKTGIGPELALPGGTGINITIYTVLAGNGGVLNKVGVRPDVVVELTAQDLDRGVDTQLQRAIQILSR